MEALLPPALPIGVARSISVVLAAGHVIDTVLHGLATTPGNAAASVATSLIHLSVHIPVPRASAHAVLTMPIPDHLGLFR